MTRSKPNRHIRLNLEWLEHRVVPASPVILLNNFANQGATLRGFENFAHAGRSVASAGDVNGDGFADLIVGAPFTDAGGSSRGEAYVVFGGSNLGGTIPTLNALGTGGFTLRDFEDDADAGVSVAGAGDVNGDGFADMIVGAPFTNAGGTNRGEAYIVFGGSNRAGTTVLLNALGTGGFTLRGSEDFAYAGRGVSGAGDVNGDGFADLIVGANGTDAGGTDRGEAYVVFGGASRGGTTVTLNALGAGGSTLRGFEDGANVGRSVSGAGDVNGDGFTDLIVGAYGTDAGGSNRGETYVVFGGSNLSGTTVTLNALGAGGFTLRGFENGAFAGYSVSGAGDVNGDGFADLIVGATGTNVGGTDRGEAYVVFGGTSRGGTTVTLNALGTGGSTLRGFEDGANAGTSVAGAGDANGDGFADLLVGAPFTNAGGAERGEAYVIFGGRNRGGTTVTLNALGAGGFTLRGFEDNANAGVSVAGAGDVNGDGFADLIVGAYTDAGGSDRGEASVIFAPLPATYAVGSGAGIPARVNVYDAKSGQPRATFLPYGSGFTGGVHVAVGDVNADGAADIITGPGPGPSQNVRIFDGRTFNLISEFSPYGPNFTGGVNVAAGDMNGDGRADIITGAGPNGSPHVRVVSGANVNTALASFFAYASTFTGGVNVALGDDNGDGKADLITGAGPTGGPHVKVFNANTVNTGADSELLAQFFAFVPTYTGGVNIAAGDLNGDGKVEVIAAAETNSGPLVRVFSQAGALLQSFFGYSTTFSGGVNVAARDVDGDGRADILTGAGAGGGPHVKAFRGTDEVPLRSFFAFDPGFQGGVYVG